MSALHNNQANKSAGSRIFCWQQNILVSAAAPVYGRAHRDKHIESSRLGDEQMEGSVTLLVPRVPVQSVRDEQL